MWETDSLASWDRIRQLQFSGATDLNSGENVDMAFYDFCVSFLHCTGAEFGKPIDSKRLISTMDSSKCITLLYSVQCLIILCLILIFSFVINWSKVPSVYS